MLAFMGTQSFIMMYQAGEGWQYGKRKQSALSNEEFNKQTPLSIMDRQRTELINALPSIKDSMNAMTPLIDTIVTQYGDFINATLKALPETAKKATEGLSIPGFPFAFGSEQKTTSPLDWLPVITGILDFLSAGHLLTKVTDKDTFTGGETEEEQKANDLIIQEQTLQEKQKFIVELKEGNQFGNTVPKQPVFGSSLDKPQSLIMKTHGEQINAYHFQVAIYVKSIQHTTQLIKAGGTAPKGAQFLKVKAWKATLAKNQKLLKNYITIAKNTIFLKPFANQDFLKKIWIQ